MKLYEVLNDHPKPFTFPESICSVSKTNSSIIKLAEILNLFLIYQLKVARLHFTIKPEQILPIILFNFKDARNRIKKSKI